MNRTKKLLHRYSAFFEDMSFFVRLACVWLSPLYAAMLSIALGVYLNPLAVLIPSIPFVIWAIREDMRKQAVVMSEAFEGSGEKWKKSVDEYVKLLKDKKKC